MEPLHPSLLEVLHRRGYRTPASVDQFLNPPLELTSFSVTDMDKAVLRLRSAIRAEEPIGIYADRDVDGLSGLAILARSLRTLGGQVVWGSPLHGRGIERAVLERLIQSGIKTIILVDCGTGEDTEVGWLAAQGIDVIIADHHRVQSKLPGAYAWIHPGMTDAEHSETPCGSTMAFTLAEGLWRSFIGPNDPERLQYFLYDHLDLVALGILADRVPLTGDNRRLVWHGLKRLAKTRKEGLAALNRFFRIKGDSLTVRQASWQIIPLLNAAGRLRQPHWAANLLMTEDPWTARECIDALLGLNTVRRQAQVESLDLFERSVLEQCSLEKDAVLVATAQDLEPSVTGLAASSLAEKYNRPTFLFVEQGDDFIGSGRGTPDVDLFAWVEEVQDLLLKFGGHHGAVGMTVRKSDFPALREGLYKCAESRSSNFVTAAVQAEAELHVDEAGPAWWASLQRLEPFGQGFEVPAFELKGVVEIIPRSKRSQTKMILKSGKASWSAELPSPSPALRAPSPGGRGPTTLAFSLKGDRAHLNPSSAPSPGSLREGGRRPDEGTVVAIPQATPKEDFPFKWLIQK